jgi:hypothetical protein
VIESLLDRRAVAAAESEVSAAIAAALATSSPHAVVGVAPAGAGKSYAIGSAVEAARKQKLRVVVATPTNEQAFALIRDLAARFPREKVVFVNASHVHLPEDIAATKRNVACKMAKDSSADAIVVATLSKLGDAFSRGDFSPRDVLLIDEAYQANSVQYYAVGDIAPRHLLMGDSGQLAPFSSAPGADRWRGLAEDPLLTSVEVLRKHHPHSKIYRLPVTRRLDPRAVRVVAGFYPDHAFSAAVLPDVRQLELAPKGGRSYQREDTALDLAASTGWAHVELAAAPAIAADPEALDAIVRLTKRLLMREATTRCEHHRAWRPLVASDIAIAVSHNDQKLQLRLAMSRAGLDVVVDTANKLQGLTFQFVIAWHPLAGMLEADEFHLDPGRLCVMLTRHRHACIVLGRAGDRELVQGIPPATPAYVGWDANPALAGWYVHEAVFDALEPHRVSWPTSNSR